MARSSLYDSHCSWPLPWTPLSGCEAVISAAVTDCCCLSCRPTTAASTSKEQDGNILPHHGQGWLGKKNQRLVHLLPHEVIVTQFSCSTLPLCHGPVLQSPVFHPCSGVGKALITRCLLQWQVEGWKHSLHPEGYRAGTSQLPPPGTALAHPHALCAAAQLPEPCALPGMRCGGSVSLTLCVSGQKMSCRLLGIQRSATNKGALSISHSRGCIWTL